MNVQELIDKLSKVEDKTLDVRLEIKKYSDDPENFWLVSQTVRDTGMSGYEIGGEVVLYDWDGNQ